MKVAYEKPLNSLALLSAFRVGNCIAITEEDITQDTWYCYTETYYGYQQTICLGHGMGLILKMHISFAMYFQHSYTNALLKVGSAWATLLFTNTFLSCLTKNFGKIVMSFVHY